MHHGDLFFSLQLLFEKRLGWNLYRPIGIDWFEQGFWKLAEPYGNAPDTIDQYLGIPKETWDRRKEPTQTYGHVEFEDGVYYVPVKVPSGWYIQKAITFEQFLKMDFDLVIASYGGHDYAYSQLVQKHKPQAIYIRQIGNIGEVPKFAKNALLAIHTPMPPDINNIIYYPELDKDYSYTPPTNHNMIKSFIAAPLAEPDLPLFYEFEKRLSEFTFKMHGILGRDGVISGDLMPQAIKDSAFVWHVKHTGCGGFVGRQALACGRPCIIKKHYGYEHHMLEENLFEDGINCIDLDVGNIKENVEKIRFYSEPDRHAEMCKKTSERFQLDVNYDADAQRIKIWLDNLRR